MRNIYLTFLLLAFTFLKAVAQKTYVTAAFFNTNEYGKAQLSGDVPATMKRTYDAKDIPKEERENNKVESFYWIGYVLNLLAKEGFSVEQQSAVPEHSHSYGGVIYLLSKPAPDLEKDEKEKKE